MPYIDFTTPEGVKLRAHLSERLQELRLRNDDSTLTERETYVMRGAISEIKRLLSDPPPVVKNPRYSGRDNEQ